MVDESPDFGRIPTAMARGESGRVPQHCGKLGDARAFLRAPCYARGALPMAAGQLLAGEPMIHVDIIRADLSKDTAVLRHCGNLPRRLAETPDRGGLRPIPKYIDPGAHGPMTQTMMAPGPMTIANLEGCRGTMRLCDMDAEAAAYGLEFPRFGRKVVFPWSLAQTFEQIGNVGFGHHFVVKRGHLTRELREWRQLAGGFLALATHA